MKHQISTIFSFTQNYVFWIANDKSIKSVSESTLAQLIVNGKN